MADDEDNDDHDSLFSEPVQKTKRRSGDRKRGVALTPPIEISDNEDEDKREEDEAEEEDVPNASLAVNPGTQRIAGDLDSENEPDEAEGSGSGSGTDGGSETDGGEDVEGDEQDAVDEEVDEIDATEDDAGPNLAHNADAQHHDEGEDTATDHEESDDDSQLEEDDAQMALRLFGPSQPTQPSKRSPSPLALAALRLRGAGNVSLSGKLERQTELVMHDPAAWHAPSFFKAPGQTTRRPATNGGGASTSKESSLSRRPSTQLEAATSRTSPASRDPNGPNFKHIGDIGQSENTKTFSPSVMIGTPNDASSGLHIPVKGRSPDGTHSHSTPMTNDSESMLKRARNSITSDDPRSAKRSRADIQKESPDLLSGSLAQEIGPTLKSSVDLPMAALGVQVVGKLNGFKVDFEQIPLTEPWMDWHRVRDILLRVGKQRNQEFRIGRQTETGSSL